MEFSRVFLIVLDGVGVGLLPEEEKKQMNTSTLGDVVIKEGVPNIPTLTKLGFMNLCEAMTVDKSNKYIGYYGKMSVVSPFKDSWAGHWELSGATVSTENSQYWDYGFPAEVIKQFEEYTGYKVIGNKAFLRREEVIYDLLPEHIKDEKSVIILTERGVESNGKSLL